MSSGKGAMSAPAELKRELRLRDLVLFNVCAILSVRWVAAAGHAGPGSLLLWVLAAAFFFLPSAVVVAGLSARFPEVGGMYVWTKAAFGDGHAFLCSWLYFVSTILYFPSLLLAGVSMTAFIFGSAGARFAEERTVVLPLALAVLWVAFLANLLGVRVAKFLSGVGGTAIFVTCGLLIGLGMWVGVRFGPATQFRLLPSADFDTLNFWSQIAFAFVGLELAPIMSGEIRNPQRDVPRAAVISGLACTGLYVAATAALLVVLPADKVSPLTGLAQAGAAIAGKLQLPFITVVFAMVLGMSVAGQLDAWIAGNTRLPYAIGLDNYLPSAFGRLHPRFKTPYVALILQAITATMFLLMAELGETVRSAYQILVDMAVITTLIPFLYIFGAGFRYGAKLASISGLAVTVAGILLSLAPPPEVSSVWSFELKVIGGCVLFVAAGRVIFLRNRSVRRFRAGALNKELF